MVSSLLMRLRLLLELVGSTEGCMVLLLLLVMVIVWGWGWWWWEEG